MVVCGFFIFAIVGNVAVGQTTKLDDQTQNKIPVSSKSVIDLVNINSADPETLHKIKWISKKKAQAIVNYRDKNGSFKTVDDLLKVKCTGINKKWLDKISKFLTV